MSKTAELDSFNKKFGPDGLRFLLLFKTIKKGLLNQLKLERKTTEMRVIDEMCLKATEELLINHNQTPSEQQIDFAIQNLKKKLGSKF
jgi:hypothetical protein